MRFVNPNDSFEEELLKFPQVRNALLALVQHGVVSARPHPQVASSADSVRSLLQVYSIDLEEILARLRFPHFLEHTLWAHGELAYELLFVVLRYGRASAGVAIAEARRALPGFSAQDFQAELQRLVKLGLLRVVEPFSSGATGSTAVAAAEAPPGGATGAARAEAPEAVAAEGATAQGVLQDASAAEAGQAASSAEEQPGQKRKRPADDDDDRGMANLVAAQQPSAAAAAAASSAQREAVYRYSRITLNLCICKNLLCRAVDEKVNCHAGQVLAALLTAVSPSEEASGSGGRGDARGVNVEYMQFETIDDRMRELGFHQAGRDPVRERERLRKVLDLLASHKDGLVRRRVVAGGEGTEVLVAEGSSKGSWVKCRILGPGNAPDTKRVRLLEGRKELPNVPAQSLRRSAEPPSHEWCVEWQGARRVLLASATSQLVRDQFSTVGLRIFNLLNERNPPQKLEEKDIFNTCMVPPAEGREVLNEMVRRFIIRWQEVPKSANTPLSASYWLYYVDRRRVELAVLQSALQAVLNLRTRFRAESAKVVPLESRRDSLTAKERAMLNEGRRTEDILERSFLVLDAVVLIFRCF